MSKLFKNLFSFLLLAFFAIGISTSVKAGDWYKSNTGFWVETGDGGFYCEWSYFKSTCKSGSTHGIGGDEKLEEPNP